MLHRIEGDRSHPQSVGDCPRDLRQRKGFEQPQHLHVLPLAAFRQPRFETRQAGVRAGAAVARSEEHTSELQSPDHLVCRLLLEKKNKSLYMTYVKCILLLVVA